MNKMYRSIFISDIHLGSRGCKADLLCDFLKHNNAENLYLVGDIIDGWRLKKRWYWPQSHSNVVRKVLTAANRGTQVHYIAGNHDEVLRPWIKMIPQLGNLTISNRQDYQDLQGRKFLVIHGDMFDSLMTLNSGRFLMNIGDKLYDLLIKINDVWSAVRSKLGLPYWSVSKWIKHNTKQAVGYVLNFEKLLSNYCKSKGYDGVICGHIHTAEIKDIDGIVYMNDGDWVESCSALVETWSGEWKLIFWKGSDKFNAKNTHNN